MTTHVIMNVDRPNGSGGIYKAGVEYDLADDLATLWRGMGICRLTTVRSEQTGAVVSATTGNFPDAPAMNKRIPVEAIPSGSGVRFVAPSGTVAADGTITLGTALPAVLPGGAWMYLPAGAFSVAPAGWYWVVMSSATVGTVFAGQGGAAVVGSASAYTGVTSKLTAYTVTFDSPGEGKSVTVRVPCMFSASTNAKTCRMEIGATQLLSMAVSTAGQSLGFMQLVFAGLGGGVVAVVNGNGGSSSAGAILSSVGNTITVDITLQLATATEYVGAAAAVAIA